MQLSGVKSNVFCSGMELTLDGGVRIYRISIKKGLVNRYICGKEDRFE
jgi:hypothetical protein